MKRFMDHEELARDCRFKRNRSRNQVMNALPNDLNGIVRLFEDLAPKIRERVKGTALEAVFDEVGPGFQFLTLTGGTQSKEERSPLQMRMQLHGVFVGELQALEAAGRTTWDFPESDWNLRKDFARQCWDEARHVQIFEKLLQHFDGEVGEFAETTFLFEASCNDDPVLRLAGVNRCLEGLACDVFRSLIDYGHRTEDEILAQAVDFVLADELTHVRFGSEWIRRLTRDDPERAQRAREFQKETDRSFSFGGQRQLAREERIEAGFSEEELNEIEEMSEDSPSRELLVRAGEILRERHQARIRGEEVPAL